MAPVVWGLDLAEIKWSKFKSSYMWNNEYYRRRTKFIVYQCALIFCVVSESLGTAVLSDYLDGQNRVENVSNHRVTVKNNDYVGAGSYNIFAGVFVAFIFGAAFFFDLFWPERYENKGVRLAWKVCGVLAVIFHLADALTLTIITAMHRARVEAGIPPDNEQYWWNYYSKHSQDPLKYKHNARAVAAVVFVWLGWVSVLASCVLLFMSINHTEKGLGAKSKHARERDGMRSSMRTEMTSKDNQKSLNNGESPSTSAGAPQSPQPELPEQSVTRDARTNQGDAALAANEATSRSERMV